MARRVLPRARPLDDRVPARARLYAGTGLSGRARGGRVFPPLRGGASAPPRRVLAPVRRARHDVSQHVAAGAAAAHAGGVAPPRPAPDGGLALVLRRRRRARGGEGLPAPLLHPLLRPVGTDRAGRHGELELRPQGQPRDHRAAAPLQLRDGPGPLHARLRGPRTEAAGRDHRRDDGERQRAQPARLLPALAAVHGSRELERPGVSDVDRLLVKSEVEEFLYREAELLDERRYQDWLELFTEDVRYWMPIRRNVPHDASEREFTREGADVNWFDEGKDTLARRVQQILTGIHWAEEPPSRICHMISNVQVLRASPDGPAPSESTFKIARRKIILDQSVLLAKNLTFFF